MISTVPNMFKILTNKVYPPYNTMVFEEYFMNHFKEEVERIYLPIMWTSFYIKRKYGTADMQDLQTWLDGLDRSKKYFTVLQYDDGILQNIDGLDLLIFGAGGGGKRIISENNLGIPIPLICQSSPVVSKDKDILCSFVGTIKNHRLRRKVSALFVDEFVIKDTATYNVFIDTMERSIFSLCPRGYGATSFRICESLQHGSIPVYIYDKPWIPFADEFNFSDIGILIHESEIGEISRIINNKVPEEIEQYQINGKQIYDTYFTFEGCTKTIIRKLKI